MTNRAYENWLKEQKKASSRFGALLVAGALLMAVGAIVYITLTSI